MPQVLRILSLFVVAIWLGATVFLTVGIGPAFFSPEMLQLMPRYHAGRAAQLVLERFFLLQTIAAGLTLLLLLAEWAYAGRAPRRWVMGLAVGLLGLVLMGGTLVQPKLQGLHAVKYAPDTPAERRSAADAQFRGWHAVSQVGNLIVLLGVAVYFWRLSTPPPLRPAAKYAGLVG